MNWRPITYPVSRIVFQDVLINAIIYWKNNYTNVTFQRTGSVKCRLNTKGAKGSEHSVFVGAWPWFVVAADMWSAPTSPKQIPWCQAPQAWNSSVLLFRHWRCYRHTRLPLKFRPSILQDDLVTSLWKKLSEWSCWKPHTCIYIWHGCSHLKNLSSGGVQISALSFRPGQKWNRWAFNITHIRTETKLKLCAVVSLISRSPSHESWCSQLME